MTLQVLGYRFQVIGLFFVLFLFFPFYSANALSISPVRQTVVVDPGEGITVSVDATNDTGNTIVLRPSVESFSIDKETGMAVFGQKDSAIEWVRFARGGMMLRSGEKKSVSFTIAAPSAAEPVSHYLALFLEQVPPEEGQITIGAKAGSLLYLHVGGERRESLVAEYFSPGGRWIRRVPFHIDLQLKNSGTIHVIPSGEVRVLGRKGRVLAVFSVNDDARTILPNGRWVEAYAVDGLSWQESGRLRADVFLRYGLTNQEFQKEVMFWYVPWGAVVGIFGIIFCGIGGLLAWGTHKTKRIKD